MEQQTVEITSDLNDIDLEELKEQLERDLTGSDIELYLRRRPAAQDRFDFGLLMAVLAGAAKVAPLITALATLIKSRRPNGHIKLLAHDGTTILEVPAGTSREEIDKLLALQANANTLKEIKVV